MKRSRLQAKLLIQYVRRIYIGILAADWRS